MNVWANTVITNKGYALLAKLTQGHTLDLVEAITGAGYVTPGLLQNQTAVTDPKQSLVFRQVSYPETGKCALPVALTNEGLDAGYVATQVGVFANDPDEGKILFFIAQSVDAANGTIIPSETEIPSYSAEWVFNLKYGQADGVEVTVDPAGTVSREEMAVYVGENALKFNHAVAQMPVSTNWRSVAYGGGKFVALASEDYTIGNFNIAAYSEDGINWTSVTLPANALWRSVAYGSGKFIAVASDKNYAYSEDGINWTAATWPVLAGWSYITYGSGKFVVLSGSTGGDKVIYSEDGINWTQVTLPVTGNWTSITYGGGKFVAVSRMGDVAYSNDGVVWNQSFSPSGSLTSVAYGSGKFVAMSFMGPVYSEDGINWVDVVLPFYANFVTVAYGDGKFVAVASDAVAAYSEDGINWTETTISSSSSDKCVTYGNGKFVVVQSGSDIVLCSEDGINWKHEFYTTEQDGEDVSEGVRKAIGAATKEDVKKAVTVTSDVRLHLSVTADGILQVTVLDDEGG